VSESFRLKFADDDVVFNPSLTVKLANDFALTMPTAEDWDGESLESLLESVRSSVRDQDQWTVRDRVVLTTFTFHKEAMYRDLLDNQEGIVDHPLVQLLGLGPDSPSATTFDFDSIPDEVLDDRVPPEDLASIRDADSTQRQCIIAAREGMSFVVDGPPGTGKSQTITNIIAELMLLGRTVLFVSEKAAALEVVYKRLAESHLSDFVLELHSHNATRKAVAEDLGRALNSRPAAATRFGDSDRARLMANRTSLSNYAQAMNEVRRPLGRSLHQVLGRVAALSQVAQAPPPQLVDTALRVEQLNHILDQAKVLEFNWDPVALGRDFLWRDLIDSRLSAGRHNELVRRCEDARQALAELRTAAANAVYELHMPEPENWIDATTLHACLTLLDEKPPVPATWLFGPSLEQAETRLAGLALLVERHHALTTQLEQIAGTSWSNVDGDDAPRFQAALDGLKNRTPTMPTEPSATASEMEAASVFFAATEREIAAFEADGRAMAAAFGLSSEGLSLQRISQLAELAALVGVADRPEAQWLNPAVQEGLDRALAVLDELVRAFREQQARLETIFTPEVLTLDLVGIRTRFAEVHTGVGKLRKQYREDKAILGHATVAGKITKPALAHLDEAVAWAEFAKRLDRAESEYGSLVGTFYYKREYTDIAQVASVVEVAKRAVELAGSQLNVESLQRALSREVPPDAQLKAKADGVLGRLSLWRETALGLVPIELLGSLETLPCSELFAWCNDTSGDLSVASEVKMAIEGAVGRTMSIPDASALVSGGAEVKEITQLIESAQESDTELLGSLYAGVASNCPALVDAASWSREIRSLLDDSITPRTAQALLDTALGSSTIAEQLASAEKTSSAFLEVFQTEYRNELELDLGQSFDEADELLSDFVEAVPQVDSWSRFSSAKAELEDAGLEAVVRHCVGRRVPAQEVLNTFERAVLEAWSDSVIAGDAQRLAPSDASQRDALVTDFQELDRRLLESAAARVVNECAGRRPSSLSGAAGVIAREAEKQRKHMPIRTLLERAGPVAQALKPCFMMSPLSVSQYLPSGLSFDVVIFDEASQVLPSDAINCVYRSEQLIVAGDENQLPPSNFFTAGLRDDDDTYDEEDLEDFESVLKLCKASGGLRSLGLNWHYRSQHEDLITYSNHAFYEGRLHTFPGAAHIAPDLGIEIFKVDGVYRRGAQRDNPIEATKVVERVLFHRRNHPDLSLGVVTFSAAQEDAVVAELERHSLEHPELAGLISDDRLDGFFVKNLEDVQGDERDIIVFSVGYGPDQHGKFTLQMGPLTKAGGWRRLNVAITRARRRVEVVTSVLPGDFPAETVAPGVLHLRRYIDFGIRGVDALALDPRESLGEAESPFEEEVLATIRRLGYEAVPQVGLAGYRIDIGVRDPRDPGRFLLGVECDGAMYHSSKVARDRDRLRQKVIEGLGWRIHRIWGIAWFRDRASQESRLQEAIEAAMRPPERVDRSTPELAQTSVVHESVDFDALPEWTVPYRVCTLPSARGYAEMHDPNARPQLRSLLRQVIEAEAPVHRDRALRLVREAWGVGRAGHRIRSAFDAVVRELDTRGECRAGRDGFLRKPTEGEVVVRVPTENPETVRPVTQVPNEELDLAVLRVVKDAHAIATTELRTRVARLFGWARTGTDITDAIDASVARLVTSSEVSMTGELLTVRSNGSREV
jgi:very-short-patch-repair endonuclease